MAPSTTREFTMEEVAKHTSRDDALIIVNDRVYDISKFLSKEVHPGGEVIWTHAGKDASDVLDAYHPPYVFKKKLGKYCVGTVKAPAPVEPMVAAYRQMHDDIKKAGLYNVRPMYWFIKCAYPLCMIFVALAIFRLQSDSVLVNLGAGFIVGLAQHQWAFVGHDGCHRSMLGVNAESYNGNALDFVISMVFATAGFGCSSIWWKYTHNQHHVVVNEFDRDPDVTHLPFYAVSRRMFLSLSTGKRMSGLQLKLCRLLVGVQHVTFFPIMLLVGRASLIINVLAMQWWAKKVPSMPWQPLHYSATWVWLDRLAMIAHVAWMFALFSSCPPAGHRFLAFLASWITVSFLHVQLVLSHWERPMKHSTEEEDNWFVKQVITGCNIEPFWWNEWLLGGLHFQIEHHLYPRMPRYSLRQARDEYVVPFCRKWGVHYQNASFLQCLGDVVAQLAEVSTHARESMTE